MSISCQSTAWPLMPRQTLVSFYLLAEQETSTQSLPGVIPLGWTNEKLSQLTRVTNHLWLHGGLLNCIRLNFL